MKRLFGRADIDDDRAKIDALMRSQAVMEFGLDGTILTANDNYLNLLGYSLPEIVGKHHRLFVDAAFAQSAEYRQFWAELAAGKYQGFTGGWARVAGRSGSRQAIIRCSTSPAGRSR